MQRQCLMMMTMTMMMTMIPVLLRSEVRMNLKAACLLGGIFSAHLDAERTQGVFFHIPVDFSSAFRNQTDLVRWSTDSF